MTLFVTTNLFNGLTKALGDMDVGFWLTLLLLFAICLLCRLNQHIAQAQFRPAPNQQGDEAQGDWDDNDGANQQGPEDGEANDEEPEPEPGTRPRRRQNTLPELQNLQFQNLQQQDLVLTLKHWNILPSFLAKINSLDVRKNIDMAEPELQFRGNYDSILFADISGFTNLASLSSSDWVLTLKQEMEPHG